MLNKKTIQKVADTLLAKKQTLAVAESVTAGLLQNAFAGAEDATCFFQGGITAYNLEQKLAHFTIDEAHARACNCVSEKVSAEMAVGVAKNFKTNWGIAITGYASPVPEKNIDTLYACYSIVFNGKVLFAKTIEAKKDKPGKVQVSYVNAVMEDFLKILV